MMLLATGVHCTYHDGNRRTVEKKEIQYPWKENWRTQLNSRISPYDSQGKQRGRSGRVFQGSFLPAQLQWNHVDRHLAACSSALPWTLDPQGKPSGKIFRSGASVQYPKKHF
ncbi:unnamed protein product [Lepidochelys olivacea]